MLGRPVSKKRQTLKLFVAVTGHGTLLPHFLRHYEASGVTQFFVATDSALADQVVRLGAAHAMTLVTDVDAAESIEGGTLAVSEMRRRFAGPDEWVVIADLDEFQRHPAGLTATVEAAEAEGANVVRGVMVDRVATDGLFKPVGAEDDLWRLFPERCYATTLLQRGLAYKCAVVKAHLESGRAENGLSLAHHHMQGERVASKTIEIDHFKWNSEVLGRMATAIRRTEAVGQPFAVKDERVLDHLRRYGRLRWEQFQNPAGQEPTA